MQGKTHGLKDRVISAGLPATLIVTETCMVEEEGAPADGMGSAESGGRGAKNTARGKMCMASLAKKASRAVEVQKTHKSVRCFFQEEVSVCR